MAADPYSGQNISVIRLTEIGDERLVPVQHIMAKAEAEKLDEIMVIGRTADGELWCSSSLNAGQSLWLLEKLRERILAGNPWSVL
jgi:hypothetical protein